MRAGLLVIAALALAGFIAVAFVMPSMAGSKAKEAGQAAKTPLAHSLLDQSHFFRRNLAKRHIDRNAIIAGERQELIELVPV